MVKVRHDGRRATRIGRELCAVICEDGSEALVADGIGQPSSHEIVVPVRGADVLSMTEGKTDDRESQVIDWTSRGLRPWHVSTSFRQESGELRLRPLRVRIGKVMS